MCRTAVAVAVLATMVPVASADPAARWTIAPLAGTDFPLDVSVGVAAEAPHRIKLSTTIGVLPGPYVDVLNAFLTGIGVYDQATADLVRASLSSSLVWRTHAGWRPWAHRGFYALAGYGLVTLGGGATGSQIIEAATGRQLPATDRGMPRSFTCQSTLHMLDVELGYEWHLSGHWLLHAALGGVFTVAAHTTIDPDYQPLAPMLTRDFADAGAAYLDDIYTSYVFSPVITIAGGYAF